MQRLALAAVLGELVQCERELGSQRAQPLLDTVARPVVDHDHLLLAFRVEHGADRLLDELGVLVEARHDDRDALPAVRPVTPRAQVVQEQQRKQVHGVDDEHEQVRRREREPEADAPPVLRQEEQSAPASTANSAA